jgi:Fe-S-cluster containining protein
MTIDKNEPWYKDGLRFQCTECGQCCTGAPGYVWVNDQEIADMAEFLAISVDTFKKQYLRRCDNRWALVELKSQKYDCVFLNGKKCLVYNARPTQCRTFPWWKENLNTEESWKIAGRDCEGINDQAPIVPYSQIVQLLRENESRKQLFADNVKAVNNAENDCHRKEHDRPKD